MIVSLEIIETKKSNNIYTHTQQISIREKWVTFKRIILIALQKLNSQYKERHDIFSKFKKKIKKYEPHLHMHIFQFPPNLRICNKIFARRICIPIGKSCLIVGIKVGKPCIICLILFLKPYIVTIIGICIISIIVFVYIRI